MNRFLGRTIITLPLLLAHQPTIAANFAFPPDENRARSLYLVEELGREIFETEKYKLCGGVKPLSVDVPAYIRDFAEQQFLLAAQRFIAREGCFTSLKVVRTNSQNLSKWRSAKLGLFIMLGPWSQTGIGRQPLIMNHRFSDDEIKRHFALKKTFDPEHLNIDWLVKVAKKSKFKYVVFMGRQHDGANVYKLPIILALAQRFRREKFMIGFYFNFHNLADPDSQWSHYHRDFEPDFIERHPNRWADYVKRFRSDLLDLLRLHNPDILWFDSGLPFAGRLAMLNFIVEIKDKFPKLLINDRGTGVFRDYVTYEDAAVDNPVKGPWEVTMPVSNGPGFWFQQGAKYKTPNKIRSLINDTLAKGGNFLLAISPNGTGRLHMREVEVLENLHKN